jgi:hypothetical protein
MEDTHDTQQKAEVVKVKVEGSIFLFGAPESNSLELEL